MKDKQERTIDGKGVVFIGAALFVITYAIEFVVAAFTYGVTNSMLLVPVVHIWNREPISDIKTEAIFFVLLICVIHDLIKKFVHSKRDSGSSALLLDRIVKLIERIGN